MDLRGVGRMTVAIAQMRARLPAPRYRGSKFCAFATELAGMLVFRFRRSMAAGAPHVAGNALAPGDSDQLGHAGRRRSRRYRRKCSAH
jgi:hypothetical protein